MWSFVGTEQNQSLWRSQRVFLCHLVAGIFTYRHTILIKLQWRSLPDSQQLSGNGTDERSVGAL